MSLPVDDLLSAFHDGNLSAGEQATVDRRLTLASAARQELSEIRQVSALLKSLPCETLPPEFPQQVLAAIEREMLVPSRPDDHPSDVTFRQRWVIGGAAVLTSAAGLLLMLNVFGHSSATDSRLAARSMNRPESRYSASDIAAADRVTREGSQNEADGRLNGNVASTPTSKLAMNAPASGPAAAGGFGGGAGVNRLNADASGRRSTEADRTNELFFDKAAFGTAQIGDVVEALQTEGDQVAVVRLTVVDRLEGLKELQLLLTKSQIEVAEPVEEAEKLKETATTKEKADQPQPAAPDQMLAVFVESDSQQLTAALQELRDTKLVESLEVEAPILVAELGDAGVKASVAALDKAKDKATASNVLAKSAREQLSLVDALTQAKKSASPRRRASQMVDEAKKAKVSSKPTESPKSDAATTEKSQAVARQYAFQVPAESLSQGQQSPATRNRAMSLSNRLKQSAQDRKSGTAADGVGKSEARPMQVLFFVVDQTQVDQSTPATAPKANAPAKARSQPAKPETPEGAA